MRLLNPLGLIGLLGIPLLIWLYIIKQKHVPKKISSSFIWKKSKLGVRKIKWQRIKQYLLIAFQLLVIIVGSLILSKPVLNKGAGKEYVVILDGSASMLAKSNGKSRYDDAIARISKLANKMEYSSYMTVIQAGTDATYIVKHSDNASDIKFALEKSRCSYGQSDVAAAIKLADDIKSRYKNTKMYLFTDRDYDDTGDYTVSNCAGKAKNCAVTGMTYAKENGKYIISASVISYGYDKKLTLAMYIDGKLIDAKAVECKDGIANDVIWENLDITEFANAKIVIDVDDAITEDNTYTLYYSNDEKKVLILSESSMFIRKALRAAGNFEITYDKTEEDYMSRDDISGLSGYDLYIFDGVMPDCMPSDGAIWLFNQPEDALGIVVSDKKTGGYLSLSEDTQTELYATLVNSLTAKSINVAEYTVASSYDGYETILECDNNPVVLARVSSDYEKTIVFMFDIHNSNLPLMKEFPLIINNMLNYSLKPVVNDSEYDVGEAICINMQRGAEEVYVNSKSIGDIIEGKATYIAKTPGEYSITELIDGMQVTTNCYVRIPETESNIKQTAAVLGLGEKSKSNNEEGSYSSFIPDWIYGKSGIFTLLAMALLIILTTEWWVYYNEEF